MTDCIRIDINNCAAEIWPGKAKADLADENGPLYPAAFIAALVEVPSGSVTIGDRYDGSQFAKPAAAPARLDGVTFLARVSDDEYAAVIALSHSSVQMGRWIDQLRMLGHLEPASSQAIAAKAALVATGILTQARADAIFAPA